jgi:hypothetical protein
MVVVLFSMLAVNRTDFSQKLGLIVVRSRLLVRSLAVSLPSAAWQCLVASLADGIHPYLTLVSHVQVCRFPPMLPNSALPVLAVPPTLKAQCESVPARLWPDAAMLFIGYGRT